MTRAKKGAIAPTTSILCAVGELSGGGVTLSSGEELTQAKAKAIGLDADAIDDLKGRGKLVEVVARVSESGGSAEIAALQERLDKAESDARKLDAALVQANEEKGELQERVAQLEKDLAPADEKKA